MSESEITQLLMDMISKRPWVIVGALIIGTLIRLGKSDTVIPVDIPPRLRIWVAYGLGCLSGVLEKVSSGIKWKDAILGGAVQATLAVLGQNILIDSLRGGKEIAIPGLAKPGAAPSPGKPVSIPPDNDETKKSDTDPKSK